MKKSSTKERLKDFRQLVLDIRYQKQRFEILKETGDNGQNYYTDKDKIIEMSEKVKEIYDNINQAIMKLECPETKIILQLRYLHLYSWDNINEFLYSKRDDFSIEKNSKYERRMFRFHNKGIKELNCICWAD